MAFNNGNMEVKLAPSFEEMTREMVYDYLNSLDIFQQRDVCSLPVLDIVDGIKSKVEELSDVAAQDISCHVENWLEERCG